MYKYEKITPTKKFIYNVQNLFPRSSISNLCNRSVLNKRGYNTKYHDNVTRKYIVAREPDRSIGTETDSRS